MMDYADFAYWIFVSVWVIVLIGIVLEQNRRYLRRKRMLEILDGMIESVDESVGRILATLKKNGLEAHTVMIFTSDNGGYHGATST